MLRVTVMREPRALVKRAASAMKQAARELFEQGRDADFAKAAKLMEEINKFLGELKN